MSPRRPLKQQLVHGDLNVAEGWVVYGPQTVVGESAGLVQASAANVMGEGVQAQRHQPVAASDFDATAEKLPRLPIPRFSHPPLR